LNAQIRRNRAGAILFDADLVPDIPDEAFTADAWPASAPVSGEARSTGRGSTVIVSGEQGDFVLRHFRRGGLIGRIVSDSYLWLGEEATRAFREWRLLSELRRMELPVPRPAAARYSRSGLTYRADMLTALIPDVMSLSERLASTHIPEDFWQMLGTGIALFHKAGVCHADLNAYNVQLGQDDKLWLIDFDRGRLRQPGTWQQKNLARLRRSLRKIKRIDPSLQYSDSDWAAFLEGYFNSSRLA
jgi:3-deoxy-D-manno-octulosonic acid kinase